MVIYMSYSLYTIYGVRILEEFLYAFVEWMQTYGIIGLIVVAFAGSSFFPVPPDILLIPMIFVHRKFAFLYAFITTIASVLGAYLGYFLGRKFGKPILNLLFKSTSIKKVEYYFSKYGAWSIVIAGLTPMPYKLFTIAAGTFNIGLSTLTVASLIGRGTRFFLEALFVFALGDRSLYYLENHFGTITVAIATLFILIYFIYKYLSNIKVLKDMRIFRAIKPKYETYYSRLMKFNKFNRMLLNTLVTFCLAILLLLLFAFIIR